MPSLPNMPSKPSMPSLASLADLPDVPGPVLALVGAGNAATQAARDLKAKLVNVDVGDLDLRDHEVRIDLSALKPDGVDFSKVDPRNLDVSKLDPRKIDPAAVTATGLLWAARGQERYESLVARGEAVIGFATRDTEWSDAVADDATTVVTPPAAEAPVATPPAAKKTTPKSATKPATAKKVAAPKVDPEA